MDGMRLGNRLFKPNYYAPTCYKGLYKFSYLIVLFLRAYTLNEFILIYYIKSLYYVLSKEGSSFKGFKGYLNVVNYTGGQVYSEPAGIAFKIGR